MTSRIYFPILVAPPESLSRHHQAILGKYSIMSYRAIRNWERGIITGTELDP